MNKLNSKLNGLVIPLKPIETFYYIIVIVWAVISVGLQSPGQISMDSSIQLYEAKIGESIDWYPPFMSALLRILGGGEVSAFLFVCINTILTYGALLLTLATSVRNNKNIGIVSISAWRALIVLVILLNPIIFIYVGIVWKDILFSSLLLMGASCALAIEGDKKGISRLDHLYLLSSTIFLSAAFLVRQQGVLMAPLLLLVPIYFLFIKSKSNKINISVLILIFIVSSYAMNFWATSTIKNSGSKQTDVGYRSIMTFDIAGMISNNEKIIIDIPKSNRDAILKYYEPSRIDYMGKDPEALHWFGTKTTNQLFLIWSELIINNPSAYYKHRLNAVSTLYGFNSVELTTPLHIGIDGNENYLKAVNIQMGRDERDLLVYKIGSVFTNTIIFKHFFWAGIAIVLLIVSIKNYKNNIPDIIVIVTCTAYYLAYMPTMISSDFRYLYPAIPLISIILIRKLIV
jgi:hypothetical protein